MEALAKSLPIQGVEASSKRIFTVWGEAGVGKSTFISEFRESELMSKSKVLWIQPTREGELETIPEFIRACAKSVRYPNQPEKEEKISSKLESVQRGKVNPIVSDDSILITRSSLAKEKKPYVNKAAVASVGRTEKVRDDIEVSVGLGESKANNHAEGFLDALPLQALGTDLCILYIERIERLSVTILDWIRDYVFPAATRGAYRRSLVLLIESLDPIRLACPTENWGEWGHLLHDYRLYSLSEDDTYQYSIKSGLDPATARFLYRASLGYPTRLARALQSCRALDPHQEGNPEPVLASLDAPAKLDLAALCLPEALYPEDLDALFGPKSGKAKIAWLKSLPNIPLRQSEDGHQLPTAFRRNVLQATADLPGFKPLFTRWNSYSRLEHNIPSRSDRAKLLHLSGLLWINKDFCEQLFGPESDKVYRFATQSDQLFNRNQDRYRISERYREYLQRTAEHMGHPGSKTIRQKAEAIWQRRQTEINERIEKLEAELEALQNNTNTLIRRQSEALANLRIQERKTETQEIDSGREATPKGSPAGPVVILSSILCLALLGSGLLVSSPANAGLFIGSLTSLTLAIVYLPKWKAQRKASAANANTLFSHESPEILRKQSLDLTHQVQDSESDIEDLKQAIEEAKEELRYSLV